MAKEIIIDGTRFSTLVEFYDEVERKLTKGLGWKIGRNLDAYNDVLRGGFGVHEYGEAIVIHWIHSEVSRQHLGQAATEKYTEAMLGTCHPDNIPYVQEELEKVRKGEGQMLFDLIVEITTGQEHVTLLLE